MLKHLMHSLNANHFIPPSATTARLDLFLAQSGTRAYVAPNSGVPGSKPGIIRETCNGPLGPFFIFEGSGP